MKTRTVAQIMHEEACNLPDALRIQSTERSQQDKGATDEASALMMALDARLSTISDLALYGQSYREADQFDEPAYSPFDDPPEYHDSIA